MKQKKIDIVSLLSNGEFVTFPINGWSMYPFIHNKDLVTIAPINRHIIKVNDIVLYRRPNNRLILHRVVRVDNQTVYFCGDNHFKIEGPLPIECIKGLLISFSHNGKITTVSSPLFHAKSVLWNSLRPIRPLLHLISSVIKKA